MTDKILLHNTAVLTLDPRRPRASSVYLEDGRVAALDLAPGEVSSDTEAVDVGGGAVVPGFHDCHFHLTQTAMSTVDLDLRGLTTLRDALDRLRQAAAEYSGPVLRAWNYDDSLYAEQRGPTMAELDQVTGRLPTVLFRIGGNGASVNSAAWQHFGITPDLDGVIRDASGQPSGLLLRQASHLAGLKAHAEIQPAERDAAYRRLGERLLADGITTVHAIEGSFFAQLRGASQPNSDAAYLARHGASLPFDVVLFDTQVSDPVPDLDRIADLGITRVGGDLMIDGVLGAAYTPGVLRAALSAPYADEPLGYGHLLVPDDVLDRLVSSVLARGWQLAFHAVGDRALTQVLRAYRRATGGARAPAGALRVEHAITPTDEVIALAAEIGVVFSMQPAFEVHFGGPGGRYESRLGPERIGGTHPFRQILDAGVVVAGGSDSPLIPPTPLVGMHGAVNHPNPANAATAQEALGFYTASAALAGGEGDRKGTLAVGRQADLVVLDADPTVVPPSRLREIQVRRTIRRGRTVYRRPESVAGGRGSSAVAAAG